MNVNYADLYIFKILINSFIRNYFPLRNYTAEIHTLRNVHYLFFSDNERTLYMGKVEGQQELSDPTSPG